MRPFIRFNSCNESTNGTIFHQKNQFNFFRQLRRLRRRLGQIKTIPFIYRITSGGFAFSFMADQGKYSTYSCPAGVPSMWRMAPLHRGASSE
jgi:hypothetical protein